MDIRPFKSSDQAAVIALWEACGLLRPWNDPVADIARCVGNSTSELFVGELRGTDRETPLVGVVMAGGDGHRGWLYYLAVLPGHRHAGCARRLVSHAEAWLEALGLPKVQLMIRADNTAIRDFYERLGYAVEDRTVMSRRFGGEIHG